MFSRSGKRTGTSFTVQVVCAAVLVFSSRSTTSLKLRGRIPLSPPANNPLDPQFFNSDSQAGLGLKTRQQLAPSGEFIVDTNAEVGLNNAFDNPIKNAGFLNDYLSMTKKEIASAKSANIDPKLGAALYVKTGITKQKPMGISAEELGSLDSMQVAQMTSQHMNTEEWKSVNEQIEDRPPAFHAPPGDPDWGSLNKPISPAAKRGFPDGTDAHGGALGDEGGMRAGGGGAGAGGNGGGGGRRPPSSGGSANYDSSYTPVTGGAACTPPPSGFLPGRGSNALFKQLEVHEGNIDHVYRDSRGLLTFGIGHLITSSDPEYGKPVGHPVDATRIRTVFKYDANKHLQEAKSLYSNFAQLPEEVQLIVTDMAFNMGCAGGKGLAAFKNMKRAVLAKNYVAAASEMQNSRWCGQVGRRCSNLVGRMRALGNCGDGAAQQSSSSSSSSSSSRRASSSSSSVQPSQAPAGGGCPGGNIWTKVKNHREIRLNNYHPSGVQDQAFPNLQVGEAAKGNRAHLSNYGNAPGGSTCLLPKLGNFLLSLADNYGGVTINSIAGASHSRNSKHYRGIAIDVGKLKGKTLNNYAMAKLVVGTCHKMGGYACSNPGGRKLAGCPGHSTWVHCSF